jgi:hypothetical protein
MKIDACEEGNIWMQERGTTEGWRKLYSEEFHNLYASPNILGL